MNINDAMRPMIPEDPNCFLGIHMSEPRVTDIGPFTSLPDELRRVVEQIGELEFPIDSKGDLARKLEGREAIKFGKDVVDGKMLVMFLPASYYPIPSVENLAEKVSDYYHHRRDARPRLRACTAAELKEHLDRLFEEHPRLVEAAVRLFMQLKSMTR